MVCGLIFKVRDKLPFPTRGPGRARLKWCMLGDTIPAQRMPGAGARMCRQRWLVIVVWGLRLNPGYASASVSLCDLQKLICNLRNVREPQPDTGEHKNDVHRHTAQFKHCTVCRNIMACVCFTYMVSLRAMECTP